MNEKNIALIHGNVITMDAEDTRTEAVLIEDGVIQEVGNSEMIKAIAEDKKIPVKDLKGSTVLPGFHDCHVHVMGTGMASLGVDLYHCGSVKDVIHLLEKESEKNKQGWVCGVRLDESKLQEKRPPHLEELTKHFPDRGVYLLDRGLHYSVVNQKAYEEIGFTGQEAGLRKDKEGKVNGRLHEQANAVARNYFTSSLTKEQRMQAIHHVEQEALRRGITTIHAMEGGEMFTNEDIPVFLELQGKTDVDFVLYWDTMDLEAVEKAGLPRVGTDILSDGSIGSRTAAFDEPYADDPDSIGILYYDNKCLIEHIGKALEKHLQCGFHAIGQRAIRQILDCYEVAYKEHPWEDARFRIEHFGFCDDRDIERAAKNHIIISTQPSFSYLRGGPGSVYQIRTGEKRERKAYPNRKFVEAGIVVAGGSDSNVTPIHALLGIHAAVNHPYPEHRVTVYQALRMFTIDGAYSAFEEKIKGSIERGKQGDLVILAQSPYEVKREKIKDILVEMTIKEGRIVYECDELLV